MSDIETAQQRFDRLYITSTEICIDLGVARPSIMQARKRGLLPDPIFVNDGTICIWERDAVKPKLDAWRLMLDVRRSNSGAHTE
jgi:hypothetical protein